MIVLSYPKSGRTWLIRMLASYYQWLKPNEVFHAQGLQKLTECRIPIREWVYGYHKIEPETLEQMRRHYQKKVIYVIRDPRDCAISYYYYLGYFAKPKLKQWKTRLLNQLNEAGFLRKTLQDWKEHRQRYQPLCDLTVSYEQMHADCARVLREIVGDDNPQRIEEVVAKHRFEVHSRGRQPGQENNRAFMRKGVVGDWVNRYGNETYKEIIKEVVGAELIDLGYEKDLNW